jgi:hypothetical protein
VIYSINRPRRVRSSRRGAGVEEYRVRVIPRPDGRLCAAYNESRPPEPVLPRLSAGEFVLLCAPEQLNARLSRIKSHALPHLGVVTDLVHTS